MTSDGLFLKAGSELTVLSQEPYASEDVLQRALAEHPEVVAGPTTSGADARRLLLVRREMGVPGSDGGSAVWSLDHLFVDADGVPVMVEVKRAADTRIRREVVGQLLDYAANGVRYWPIETLRASVELAAATDGKTGDEVVADLAPDVDPDEFWRTVEANLRAGRVRLLFVADVLPPELVRVIEFLNEQMSPAEVLGVELRQYVGAGQTVYVPRVVGRTAASVTAKSKATGTQWNETLFLDAARSRKSAAEVAFVERLFADVRSNGVRFGWGRGLSPGVSGWYTVAGQPAPVWNLNLNNDAPGARSYVWIYFSDLAKRVPSATVEAAAHELERIPALAPKVAEARATGWNKYPSVFLDDLLGTPGGTDTLVAAVHTFCG